MLATFHVVYFILYKVQPRFKTSSAQETFVQGSSNISNEDYIEGAILDVLTYSKRASTG